MAKGILYIVSTPIGNLGDITYRAVEVLSQVDLVAAEDTRTSRVLLNHYNIHTPVTSFHAHNQVDKTPGLLQQLRQGKNIAVISDAGTPGISDPAYYLVTRAVEEEIPVVPVPGAAAFLAALVVSGLPTNRFVFEGFLPAKKGRKKRLAQLAEEERTIVLYESPHRLVKTLKELLETLGNRRIAVARELTKYYEEVFRADLQTALQEFQSRKVRGEFVLVVEGKPKKKRGEGE
ncbi:MAG TPA: 16S rRNA (cytidine(1402)-2'-O)-methyltransferase [Bacteroidetes bacterium]|nr:16S rRNA (cytidine(1402)-2'-O)-methyltransferase [Bacteroidota bacterium]